MKLLITDATNPLGQALEQAFEREPFGLLLPGPSTDWIDASAVAQYLRESQPTLVINTLGWAHLPDAEQRALLPPAAKALGEACQRLEIPVIQFSSYRVFGGDNKSSHSEKDQPNPQSDVGAAWLAAEQALATRLEKRLILRLSWVLGASGDNLLTQVLDAVFSSQPLSVNTRLRGSPTALSDVARVVVGVVKQITCGAENWGIMHYCSSEACSEAEFVERALEVLRQLEVAPEEPRLKRQDNIPEGEPASAILTCRRIRDGFGVQARSWEPTLVPMIKQWLSQQG